MVDRQPQKIVLFFCLFLFTVGLASRVIPLLSGEERIFQQFPTEDGYLMLTIARNMALGLGMSTAEGTLPTNGTQPFATFVWSLGFVLTGADKLGGVIFAHVVLTLASMFFAYAAYRLVRKVFNHWHYSKEAALIASAFIFSSPQLLPHTMNFLETGLYLALATYVVFLFYEPESNPEPWKISRCIATGLVLGVLFLIRIDAVFIILSACLVYLYRGWIDNKQIPWQRFYCVLIFGSISVAVASPWLIHNYVNFGSVMPVSGQALSANTLAPNASVVPSTLLEYVLVIVPIPHTIQESAPIIIISCVTLLCCVGIAIYAFRKTQNPAYKAMFFMGFVALSCYLIYYGIFFGANHFVPRYFSITTPFLLLFSTMVLLSLANTGFKKPMLISGALVSSLIIVALNVRIFNNGVPHQHQQVVDWVKNNVPEDQWVGAIQTGTLGYFHDKSINLDGKVNPNALKASHGEAFCPPGQPQKENCLMEYIVQSEINYLVDWQGIGTWKDIAPLNEHFDLLVDQAHPSLAALARRTVAEK